MLINISSKLRTIISSSFFKDKKIEMIKEMSESIVPLDRLDVVTAR